MAQGTKITFSEAEREAMVQPDFFYIKHAVVQKVMDLMGETERELRKIILDHPYLNDHTDIETPKLFRGENYRQLPYIVLDFPRKFNTASIFAFRSMFWWGKEFSFTLHLQGAAWAHFRPAVTAGIGTLKGRHFYACIQHSPWQYHFEPDNYIPLEDLLQSAAMAGFYDRKFMKLSRKIPVSDFNQVPAYAAETMKLLFGMLG